MLDAFPTNMYEFFEKSYGFMWCYFVLHKLKYLLTSFKSLCCVPHHLKDLIELSLYISPLPVKILTLPARQCQGIKHIYGKVFGAVA